jgi:hypothetical protein
MVLVFISQFRVYDPQSREKDDCGDRENLKHQITSWKFGVHGAPPLVELSGADHRFCYYRHKLLSQIPNAEIKFSKIYKEHVQ